MDTLGFQQIKALTDTIMFLDLGRTRDFLIAVLYEKVSEVDQCVQRLIHEEMEWRNQKKAREHAD